MIDLEPSISYFNILCRYAINKLNDQKSFSIDFEIDVCIDNTCKTVPIISALVVPIPFCNSNGTQGLPGGSLESYMEQLATDAEYVAVDVILSTLGVKVILQ